ncbi:MAG: exo-alpha-sialidase [Acidobacteriota bacterium]|nr:exo-alpha-sialidase [Acidobacteriota bacterium]
MGLRRLSLSAGCILSLTFLPHLRAASGTLLPKSTFYPRLVRIAHGPASSNGSIIASTTGQIFESKDDGRSFTFLGDVPVQPGSKLICCETLYELPEAVGSLPAGTLLYSGSYTSGTVPAIEVYTSADRGNHWTYHSTPVLGLGEKGKGGLWEPQFTVAKDGALVMFWSDETYSCCSQKLAKIRTTDGVTWKDRSDAVASTVQADRPGMIVVNKLPTDVYFMSYEVCGDPITGHKCAAYYRISRDGWNYGLASDLGTRIENAEGQYFEHAPASIWSPSPLSANGVIVVVGQVLHNADKSIAPQNGKVLFVNALLDGSGPWTTVDAPVEVPNSYDNFCPNYSSALLPVESGTALLEFASDYYALKQCGTYFATKPWTAMTGKRARP